MTLPHATFEKVIKVAGLPDQIHQAIMRAAEDGVAPMIRNMAAGEGRPEPRITQDLTNVRLADSGMKTLPKFALGRKSLLELERVHPAIQLMVRRAIEISLVDFTVYDGIRTAEEQAKLLKRGATRTLDSYHLPQSSGWGHAVDLVPITGGIPKWDWNGCYMIAAAVDVVATQMEIAHLITWGAAWDRTLDSYGGKPGDYKAEMEAYARRHPGKDFLDGPHYQLKRELPKGFTQEWEKKL